MPRRLTIAFLVPNLQGGGAERVFVTLLRHIDRTRFAPTLVVGKLEGAYVKDVPRDVPTTELGAKRARHVLGPLTRWVRSSQPDVVFATTGFAAAAALTRPLWPRGTRLVSRLANTLSSFYDDVARSSPRRALLYQYVNRAMYLGSDLIVCQSDYMANDAAEVIGLGRSKLRRIYNPVDVAELSTRSRVASPNRASDGPQLLAIGNLHWRKGYDVLLHAFARVLPHWERASLTVLGEGSERPKLERLVQELGLQRAVQLPGFSANPYAALRTADLLVSSSRYEGFANVIVEALALGIPVVATDCPSGNREVLRHGIGGRLAENENPDSLARELNLALGGLAELTATVSQLRIADRFGGDTIVRQYEELFSGVAGTQDRRSRVTVAVVTDGRPRGA